MNKSIVVAALGLVTGLVEEASAQTTRYLNHDVPVACTSSSTYNFVPDLRTAFTVYMNATDTIWVRGHAYAYLDSTDPNTYTSKELAGTILACRAGDASAITTDDDYTISRTGTNLYNSANSSDIHQTKAVYTAGSTGLHTCWLMYGCKDKGDPGGSLTFSGTGNANSFIQYYAVNQYPGINWLQTSAESVLVDSTASTTAVNQTWHAEQSTASDSEVVVMWSPLLTKCVVGDVANGGCAAGAYEDNDNDGYFRWRITVYQAVEEDGVVTTCNKNFGTWSSDVVCRHHDHHCDTNIYTRAVPIVTGLGSENVSCGDASAKRRFKVYAQLMKPYDNPAYDRSDIQAYGGGSLFSNLSIYAR